MGLGLSRRDRLAQPGRKHLGWMREAAVEIPLERPGKGMQPAQHLSRRRGTIGLAVFGGHGEPQ
jgi:hypothetical protein